MLCYLNYERGEKTMNERIRQLRRSLDLTQSEFAERIGSVQNTITGYETGRRVPSSQVISLICKTFNVNEEWLRYGRGKMLAPSSSDALSALAKDRGLSDRERIALEKFLNLKPELREGLIDYFCEVAAALNNLDLPVSPLVAHGASLVEAEAIYEKSLGIVPPTDSYASNTTAGMDQEESLAAGNNE